jgi:hypothetical protein
LASLPSGILFILHALVARPIPHIPEKREEQHEEFSETRKEESAGECWQCEITSN